MKTLPFRNLSIAVMLAVVFSACSSSQNTDVSSEIYYAAAADSGSITEISYRDHRFVFKGVKPQMVWFIEKKSDVMIGTNDLQTCIEEDWARKYTGPHIDAVIFEEDGFGFYDIHFVKLMNPSYDAATMEFAFDGLWFKGSDFSDNAESGINLNKSIIVFSKNTADSNNSALQTEELTGEDTPPSNLPDITNSIIDSYRGAAEQFDEAVNKMISDAGSTLRPTDIEATINSLNAMLTRIESGTALSEDDKNLLINCVKESVTLSTCSDLTDGACKQSWKTVIQSRINLLSPLASRVNTATLTTDGLIIQAKQSIRDTISGAASTVFKTIQKLAQQMGQ